MECPFCNINLEKTRILKDGKFVRVIFSNPCLMSGHLLVIPKRHAEKISDLNKNEQEELFKTIVEFQEKILDKVASGCDIRQNYRPFQKQDRLKINHLHFHLYPRELFDELYKKCQIFEKNIFKDLSLEELDEMFRIFSEK
jgi:diadenosine tetraphosphate (Ap4A) HIT family hydrolase